MERDTSRKILYENDYYQLIRESDTVSQRDYQFVSFRRPGVRILVRNNEHAFLPVKQYRHPIGSYNWELPAGGIEANEDSLVAAKRELHEETGYGAHSWATLGSMSSLPNATNFTATLYLATDIYPLDPLPPSDATREVATQQFFSRSDISTLIHTGELRDDKTLAAFQILDSIPTN